MEGVRIVVGHGRFWIAAYAMRCTSWHIHSVYPEDATTSSEDRA
jgi:hypothetical protein